LEECSERTLRRNKDRYEFRLVNGAGGECGTRYEFLLESLSALAQARYRGEQEEKSANALLSLTDEQREVVFLKLAAVEAYQEFKGMYPRADKLRAFLAQYNEQHPDKPLTKRQLNHWEKLYKRDGVAGLVDRRGGYNKGQSSIQKDEKDVFLSYWLQEKGTKSGGPSVATALHNSGFQTVSSRACPLSSG
jgi:hypothetical protein